MKEEPKIQIINCKDCKHYKDWQGRKVCCAWYHSGVPETGFCYKAERKENGGSNKS